MESPQNKYSYFVHTTHTRTVHYIVSVRALSLLPLDPTLTFDAVLTAVAPVRDLKQLGENLGVPLTIRRERRYDKKSLVYHWLRYCPVVSWGKLAGELYHLKEKESLQLVQRYLKKTTGMLMMIHFQVYYTTLIKFLVSHLINFLQR